VLGTRGRIDGGGRLQAPMQLLAAEDAGPGARQALYCGNIKSVQVWASSASAPPSAKRW